MKGIKILLAILLVGGIALNSCKKNDSGGPMYSVRMTDAPGPYAKVNIDIQGVQLIESNGTVVTLNVHAGVYNLLNFANGLDTLIAWGNVPNGSITIEHVHLILGPNNSIEIGGQTYPIAIPAGEDVGLIFAVHQTMQGNNTIILIDFDANQSIIDEGNGHFHCRPVIRWIDYYSHLHGAIKGRITPEHTLAIVTAEANGNFFSSGESDDGDFKIRGLAAGTYTVVITPAPPLSPRTITNVTVTADQTTDLGSVSF
ncbi:MAG: hypothetical protein JWO03_2898 [Bacteroidetes bacterium]|nr:hypothetical protein [Bacteroidota bacterium]